MEGKQLSFREGEKMREGEIKRSPGPSKERKFKVIGEVKP